MRRIVAMFVVVSVVVLTCAPFALAQAQSSTERQVIPFTLGSVFNPCTGEFVTFEGTGRIVVHKTQNEGGGAIFVGNGTLHGQGVSSSGAKYVVNDFLNDVIKTPTSDEASSPTVVATLISHSNVIRTGKPSSPDNFVLRMVLHITQNANGELTASVVNTETECR